MRTLIIAAALVASFSTLLTTPSKAGEKFIGEWAGEDATSIEILSKTPLMVMYCIKGECSEWNPTGTVDDMTFAFPAGDRFPGAIMTMKRDSEFYQGFYQQTGAKVSYKVTLVRG